MTKLDGQWTPKPIWSYGTEKGKERNLYICVMLTRLRSMRKKTMVVRGFLHLHLQRFTTNINRLCGGVGSHPPRGEGGLWGVLNP